MKSNFLKKIPFLFAAIGALSLWGCGGGSSVVENLTPAETLTGITSLHYSYSAGSYANSGNSYDAVLEDGTVTVTMRRDGSDKEYTFETEPSFMDQFTEIANQYELSRWDGFHKSDSNVLDGDSFSFSLITDSDQSVSAGGYESYPKNYRAATDEIEAPFLELFESYYPSQRKILQNYLNEVLIPEHGLLGEEGKAKVSVSYPYLAAKGPNGENTYFTRQVPEMESGIVGYVITELLTESYANEEEANLQLLVYYLEKNEDYWQLSFEYFGLTEEYEVVSLGSSLVDSNLFMNDGIYSKLSRKFYDESRQLVYSGCQSSIGGDGTRSYFLCIFKLTEDGVEVIGDTMITESKNRDDWTVELIEPLLTLAEENGLDYESRDWRESPYDPILRLNGTDVTVFTNGNTDGFFNDKRKETKVGKPIGEYLVKGSVDSVRYD